MRLPITAKWDGQTYYVDADGKPVGKEDAIEELNRLHSAQPEELSAIPEGKHGEIVHLPDGLHRDTQNLVMLFAGAMAYKLNKAQDKYGYDNGWKGSAWEQDCRDRLHEHLAKGDPRDVANYCAFMWHHGWATTAPDTVAMPKAWVEAAKCDNCGGQGWKAIQVEAGVFEQEQCQWCFEQWLALGQPTLTPSPQVATKCPYCTSDNEGIRGTYYDQTCEGCVKRMCQP